MREEAEDTNDDEEVIRSVWPTITEIVRSTPIGEIWKLRDYAIRVVLQKAGYQPSEQLELKILYGVCRAIVPPQDIIQEVVSQLRQFAKASTGDGRYWLMEGGHVSRKVGEVAPWLDHAAHQRVYTQAYSILRREERGTC
jgi:hypothetical protein